MVLGEQRRRGWHGFVHELGCAWLWAGCWLDVGFSTGTKPSDDDQQDQDDDRSNADRC